MYVYKRIYTFIHTSVYAQTRRYILRKIRKIYMFKYRYFHFRLELFKGILLSKKHFQIISFSLEKKLYIHTYVHMQTHQNLHTYISHIRHPHIHTHVHTYNSYKHKYILTRIHIYGHTYLHKNIRTYITTYMHTYMHTLYLLVFSKRYIIELLASHLIKVVQTCGDASFLRKFAWGFLDPAVAQIICNKTFFVG